MAAPNSTSRNTSLYFLILAYALIVFSLWKVDTGLVGRPQFTFRQGDSVVVRTTLAPKAAGDEPGPKSIVYSHHCLNYLTLLPRQGLQRI